MTTAAAMESLRSTFDLLVLAGATDDAPAFYEAAAQIDGFISPSTVNDEIWAALSRWQAAEATRSASA